MIAASVWSLLLPAIEMAENQNKVAWVPATVGFALGVIVLILINNIADKMESKALKNTEDTVKSTSMLVLAVTLHNIPEGAIISLPLLASGKGKFKSFIGGVLSGLVEPIGAVITILLTKVIVPILPYLLSFAAGAMIYVVVNELIPEAQSEKKSSLVTIGVAVGFIIMMLLDVALG